MKRRNRRRQIELGVVGLAMSALAFIMLGLMVVFWQVATGNSLSSPRPHTPASYELEPAPVQDWRPDISHCFEPDETRELWDCIRHEEVTSLVTEEEDK